MNNQSVEPIKEYDANGNQTHYRDSDGFEQWWEYDANGNRTHYRDSNGFEFWCECDANGKETYRRDSDGLEQWWEYDANGKVTHYRNSNGFEQWSEYDANGNRTHYRNSNGFEQWSEYDANGKVSHYRNSNGLEEWYDANGKQIDKPSTTTSMNPNDKITFNPLTEVFTYPDGITESLKEYQHRSQQFNYITDLQNALESMRVLYQNAGCLNETEYKIAKRHIQEKFDFWEANVFNEFDDR